MRRIALQTAVGGIGLSLLGMGLAAVGLIPAISGAITQEVIDVLAVLNSARVGARRSPMTDLPLWRDNHTASDQHLAQRT